jgi:hypothetical protein
MSPARFGCGTRSEALVIGLKMFQVSHSWNPSQPTEMLPALGEMSTMGVWAMFAVATAVT